MVRAAKVRAASQGRNYVLPDDVKDLAPHVWTHRLVLDPEAEFAGATTTAVLTRVLAQVGAPRHRAEAPVPVGTVRHQLVGAKGGQGTTTRTGLAG